MTGVVQLLPEEAYAVALVALATFSPAKLRRLLADSAPSALWREVVAGRHDGPGRSPGQQAAELDVGSLWLRHRRAGVAVDVSGRDGSPAGADDDPDLPVVLFRLGPARLAAGAPTVTLVGTRRPTRYGLSLAGRFGAELATAGVVVLTGLTPGIDEAAHEGALAGSGGSPSARPPMGIVAGPLDRPDATARRLWDRTVGSGAVLTEVPLGHRAVPPWRFARRNRLLGALADVVVVVESHRQGRALAVAQAAAQRGATVGAVPGSVRSPASAGANDLLADGGLVVRDTADVLVALSLAQPDPVRPRRRARAAAGPRSTEETLLLEALGWEPSSLEALLRRSGLDLATASAALEHLRAAGVVRGEAGWWEREDGTD